MDITIINQDKHLCYFNSPIKIITIYDHHLYDRSDYDTLSKPQRTYLERKVADFEPETKSGRITYLSKLNRSLVYPKPAILGGSPFDILRYERQDDSFIYILTPTQAACYFLTLDDENDSKRYIEELLMKHPINIKKIDDFIRTEMAYRDRFMRLRPAMVAAQEKTVEVLVNRGQTHLGKMM
jgi:hypothetical protein